MTIVLKNHTITEDTVPNQVTVKTLPNGDVLIMVGWEVEVFIPERRGKWILHQDSRTWECSECHKYQVIHSDYCMHCGAKMTAEAINY